MLKYQNNLRITKSVEPGAIKSGGSPGRAEPQLGEWRWYLNFASSELRAKKVESRIMTKL